MNSLDDLYDYVQSLITDLDSSPHSALAERLPRALYGGSTSGEILTGLRVALKDAQQHGLGGPQIGDAISYIEGALGPPRG